MSSLLDPRIGQLVNGQFYAFLDGYDQPEFRGSLGEVKNAIGRIDGHLHVWTDAQRSAYIESLIRKTVTARILFNCPGWVSTGQVGDIAQNTFQCIDGLQRLSAVRKFMAGEIRVFGGKTAEDLRGSPFDPSRPTYQLKVGIYQFTSRSDLLRFYLDLNAGGTVHASEELDRVRGLLSVALQQHP